MTQLVMGAALGYLIGRGILHSLLRLGAALPSGPGSRFLPRLRASALAGDLIGYAGVIATGAAVVLLGLWSFRDYPAAASGTAAAAVSPDLTTALPDPPEEVATADPFDADALAAGGGADPYADPEFKVQRRPRRAGAPVSLKEALIARSESKARAELLKETQERVQRSQYDCETAERANRYLRAGLDVWAFASWQMKYFPLSSYKGASLQRCKQIKDLIDPAKVAQQAHAKEQDNS